MAVTGVITDPQLVRPLESIPLACDAPDDELLLVDWLNLLIYEMATRKMLFSRFSVKLSNHALQATAWGEPVDLRRHSPAVEVKGATYTNLKVMQDADGSWLAQCVVDV